MKVFEKVLIGLGIGTGAFFVYNYFRKIKQDSAKLESFCNVTLEESSLEKGVNLGVVVTLKNPTTTPFKIKYPYVKALYKDTVIGYSDLVNKDVSLPAFGQTTLDKMTFKIPILGIFSLVYYMVVDLLAGKPIAVTMRTTTILLLGDQQIPYEKDEPVTLKKK